MQLDIHQALIPLPGPAPLRLQAAVGTRVRAESGTLWVTVDGSLDDVVLERGQTLVLTDARPVLVSPIQGPATVALCEPQRAAGAAPSASRLERALAALGRGLLRPGRGWVPAAA